MSSVTNSQFLFVPAVATIAEDPTKAVNEFKLIDPKYDYHYSIRHFQLIAGLGLAAASLVFLKSNKAACGGLLVSSAVVLWNSVWLKPTEKSESVDQTKKIESTFNSCINGLRASYRAKAKAIHDAIDHQEMSSSDQVKKSIVTVADIFDWVLPREEWKASSIIPNEMDQATHKSLKESANKLVSFPLANLPKGLDPLVYIKMKSLQQESLVFLQGQKKSDIEGEDAYVGYSYLNGKAIVIVTEP